MKRRIVQKGETLRLTGSFANWYAKHNQATGTIAASTEDDEVTISLTQSTTDWVLLVTGVDAGRALIEITADTATSAAKDMQLLTVDVRDQASPDRGYI